MNATRLCLTVEARLERVAALRELVHSLARASGPARVFEAERVHRWALAVSEAATNAVRHAYGGDCAGPLTLEIEVGAAQLVFRLSDRGRAAETWPPTAPEVAFPAEGSYGLMIIHDVMDDVHYERRADGTNTLTMVARVGAGA